MEKIIIGALYLALTILSIIAIRIDEGRSRSEFHPRSKFQRDFDAWERECRQIDMPTYLLDD
jgi:hypothetical protein